MAGISSVLDRLEDLGDGIDDEGGCTRGQRLESPNQPGEDRDWEFHTEVESSGCGDDPLDGEGGLRLGGAKLGLGDLWGHCFDYLLEFLEGGEILEERGRQ